MHCSPPGSTVHGNSPGKHTGVGCHALLQGIFPTQESNLGLTHYRWNFTVWATRDTPAIRVVSSVYLRLLIFLLVILLPACNSSSLAFCMMCSACKLNKQGDNIQPCRTPFPIWNQSIVPRPVLSVASWPAYRFRRRQIRWSGIPTSLRIFHSLLWSTQPKVLV